MLIACAPPGPQVEAVLAAGARRGVVRPRSPDRAVVAEMEVRRLRARVSTLEGLLTASQSRGETTTQSEELHARQDEDLHARNRLVGALPPLPVPVPPPSSKKVRNTFQQRVE